MADSIASDTIPQSGTTECDTTSDDQAGKKAVEVSHEVEVDKESTPETKNENSREERKGEAKIKSEYLLVDYKPSIVSQYVPQETKDAMKRISDQNGNTDNGQPANKKLRLKGRNKKRPFEKKPDASKKLCASIAQERECKFGDKCMFLHDLKTFLASKPKDIGPTCYLFDKYGKCPYSFSCRFAQQHLTEDMTNLVNAEVYEKQKEALSNRSSNNLDKDIQWLLWKKKYDFGKAHKFIYNAQNKDGKSSAHDNDCSNVNLNSSDTSLNPDPSEEKQESKMEKAANDEPPPQRIGCVTDEDIIALRPAEKKKIDFSDKLYLAPLTTVGNLPFRRICKIYGADITCSEMAMATSVLQGKSEWALLKRHKSEDFFGVQAVCWPYQLSSSSLCHISQMQNRIHIPSSQVTLKFSLAYNIPHQQQQSLKLCGSHFDSMTRCAQLIQDTCDIDFIDINCGCPIELVFQKGEGSALMGRSSRLEQIVRGMKSVLEVPLTLKMRTGIYDHKNIAHTLIPKVKNWGVDLVTIHGRSREQRYTKLADWEYIKQCTSAGSPMPVFGNGDVYSFEDANTFRSLSGVNGLMVARGALIKPWIFTEIKEQRHWDISSSERMDMLRQFVNNGFEHWGSDHQGVETTRRFLLEWLSFLHRYIPVGILERVPQKINERPPYYFARDELETLMASSNCGDWIKISEMLLGPVPENFVFLPKHKANAYK